MNLKINGEPRSFGEPLTVMALAEALRLNPRQVAVERNRAIVPRSLYGQTLLSDGDEIEIVHFIGGG